MQLSNDLGNERAREISGGRFRNSLVRLWRARQQYVHISDWLLSFYQRVLLRLPGLPLPARNLTRRVLLRGMAEPLHVRLGTSDWYVLEEVFLDRIYQPVVDRGLSDVQQVLDLGANTGFTVRLWQTLYPVAHIVAVEPDMANLAMCDDNALKDERAGRLKLLRACVAGRARMVSLDRSGGAWRFSMRDQTDPAADSVAAVTIPQILSECAVDGTIDLLKCDIEGSEAEVFADCREWIHRVRNLIVELHEPYSAERFCEDIRRGGGMFEVYHRASQNGKAEVLFLQQVGTEDVRNPKV